MRRLEIVFSDADHHNEIWSFDNNGKIGATTFHLTRSGQKKKQSEPID